MDFIVAQGLTGLASASSLFLVSAGLTLVFGVTRVVNFAHGSLYMLGAYLGWTIEQRLAAALGPGPGFWLMLPAAALGVALIGLVLERLVLRRLYDAPELLQLLATFGLVLVIEDATLALWGPEDLLGPRAPGLSGWVPVMGSRIPSYDLFLVVLGPAVLLLLRLLIRHTRFGVLVRAATADGEMTAALGVDRARLFAAVFALGAALAGLAGALQLPRAPASLGMDITTVVEAFVVTVAGGMGSIAGAYLAAVVVGELHAFGIVLFPGITIVIVFLFMAVVLAIRPWGLLGRPERFARRTAAVAGDPIRQWPRPGRLAAAAGIAALLAAPLALGDYGLSVLAEIFALALFAASLQLLVGLGGIVSFGHAAFFGLGAYAAALVTRDLGAPMPAALAAAPLVAAFAAALLALPAVRLSGIYLAMLTLAFAQICYALAFQWTGVTGGDNGILGIWPPPLLAPPARYYYVALALALAGTIALRHAAHAPFGYGLRAVRDATLRAASIGIDTARQRRLAFALAGAAAGLAGAVHAFLKGSVFPNDLAIPLSVDGLVMVLLGGIDSLSGPVVGAFVYNALHTWLVSVTDWWRAPLGAAIVLIVLAFPDGIVGRLRRARRR